jgi:hypothetical protein
VGTARAGARIGQINALIETPNALRWRSAAATLRAFARRVDVNRVIQSGNFVAPKSSQSESFK